MLALLGGVKELAIFGSDDGPLKRSNIFRPMARLDQSNNFVSMNEDVRT